MRRPLLAALSDYISWSGTLGAHGVWNLNEVSQRLLELYPSISVL